MYDHTRLKSMVERAADMTSDARELSERDRDYYDGYQWTAEEQAVLRARKQPVITINRIKRKIDAMIGIEQRGRVDPIAYPRTPQDEEAADVATKALRYAEEGARIDVCRSHAFENLLVEGYGGAEVIVEPDGDDWTIRVNRVRWEEIVYDPHSREKDFSDAAYLGCMKWMSLDAAREFAGQFWQGDPEDLDAILDTGAGGTTGETYEDRPMRSQMQWVDRKLKRVRVAQVYYRCDGRWNLAIFTGRGELFNDASPYRDGKGQPACALYLMSGYVDRENRRSGVVRDMISVQDEVNKRRSKLLHGLNTRQTMGLKGAVDVAKMKKELSRPDGHVEIDPALIEDGVKPFEIIQNADQTRGQYELLVEAKSEIDMLGPNASLQGQLTGQQSGRAIMAQQQAGLAELSPIYDSLRDWTERIYRAVWERIRQFWTAPKWIRVTDDEEAPKFVGLNVPAMGPAGPQMMNSPAEMDVDIIIDQAPDFASLRAEQFEKLADLAKAGVAIPPDAIIEASDLRDKRKLLARMRPDPQAQQEQADLGRRNAVAEVQVKETQAQKNQASALKDMAGIPAQQAQADKVRVETALRPREAMRRASQQAAAGR